MKLDDVQRGARVILKWKTPKHTWGGVYRSVGSGHVPIDKSIIDYCTFITKKVSNDSRAWLQTTKYYINVLVFENIMDGSRVTAFVDVLTGDLALPNIVDGVFDYTMIVPNPGGQEFPPAVDADFLTNAPISLKITPMGSDLSDNKVVKGVLSYLTSTY
jgi:hypothetical protein